MILQGLRPELLEESRLGGAIDAGATPGSPEMNGRLSWWGHRASGCGIEGDDNTGCLTDLSVSCLPRMAEELGRRIRKFRRTARLSSHWE